MTALAVNGQLQPEAPVSAAQLLREAPRGAYTAATVLPGIGVPGWDLHCERLVESLQLLSSAAGECPLPALAEWGEGEQSAQLPRLLHSQMLPSLQAVASELGAPSESDCVLLVVLVCRAARLEGTRSRVPVDVYVFGKALSQHTVLPASGVVVGPGRQLPAAKDSRWVLDRAPLEQALSREQARFWDGPAEGLLCSLSGCLLEGLVTSLFVVAGTPYSMHPVHLLPRPPHAAPHPSKLGKAAPRSMQACQQIGIPVVESAPDPECRHTWREAFVTNCVRGLQPLRRIALPACVWEAPGCPGPVTVQLQQALPSVLSTAPSLCL